MGFISKDRRNVKQPSLTALACLVMAGNIDVFSEIVERVQNGLKHFFMKTYSPIIQPDQAEDLVCQTLCDALEALIKQRFKPSISSSELAFECYIYGIAKRQNFTHHISLSPHLMPTVIREDTYMEWEILEACRDCRNSDHGLNALTPQEKLIVAEYINTNSSLEVACQSLGINRFKARRIFEKACKKISQCLKTKGFKRIPLALTKSRDYIRLLKYVENSLEKDADEAMEA